MYGVKDVDIPRRDYTTGIVSTWRAERLASVPGSLPYACAIFTYDLWTPRNEKSGREPGLFYHVSDVEGREKVERT